jgi:hypothetical protein
MMSLRLRTEGFLYSGSHSIFEVRCLCEGFLPVLTDGVLGMTDEALGMTDHEGFPLFGLGHEGFALAEGYPP